MTKAVLLITFNRLDYLAEVFASVAKAQPPRLYLASDGPRETKIGEKERVEEVRKWMLEHITWDCEVKTRFLEKNSGGCGPGVSGAVTWFFENEKDGIVLEDDCVPNQTFFRFCEECLDRYAHDARVWHITGFAPIVADLPETYYFANTMHCWGWASWASRRQYFDIRNWSCPDDVIFSLSKEKRVIKYWKWIMEAGSAGKIETWDYQWLFTIFTNRGLCIVPKVGLVSNIGDVGVHFSCGAAGRYLHGKTVELDCVRHPLSVTLNRKLTERIMLEYFCRRPMILIYWFQEFLKMVLPVKAVSKLRLIRDRIWGIVS